MKINDIITENYNGEYDDEAGMVQGNLYTIAKAAQGLLDTIDDHDNLPEWVQEKIAKVEGMMVTAWNYLQSQEAQGIDPKMFEAANAAQQAAIAINMKKHHKKPKHVDESSELAEEFDLIESIIERLAKHNGVDAEVIWADLETLTEDELYAFAVTSEPIMESQDMAEGSLNELSKDTLKSYAKKAVPDMQASQKKSEIEAGKAASAKDDETAKTHHDAAKQAKDRTEKRMAGISGAIKRVTKQGVAEHKELAEEFDLIESIVEQIAQHNGVDADVVWEDLESLTEDELYAFAVTSEPIMESQDMAEDTQQVDSLVTDALKIMRGSESNDAVAALKTVLGDREYNGRRGFYNFYIRQLMDMYSQQGVMEDWQKANKRDKTDGMSQKAVNSYRREHPGSKLKTAVTTKPSKLKKGSKASKRRSSYCSRSRGQMKMHSISCSKTPDKAICKARRRWNCWWLIKKNKHNAASQLE